MSQESADRSEGDLRNTEMSLKHDRTWDYELDRIVEAVTERDASTVGLQFPEGLKRRGPRVADDLRGELPALQPLGELQPDRRRVALLDRPDDAVEFVVPRPVVLQRHPRVPEVALGSFRGFLAHYRR